jgi:hypothetical protein
MLRERGRFAEPRIHACKAMGLEHCLPKDISSYKSHNHAVEIRIFVEMASKKEKESDGVPQKMKALQ